MLYDINTITWLRQAHNILGVLIGTLPQIPQQNVFLGLPQELQPEEARLLVDRGLAFIVDDLDRHTKDLAAKDTAQLEAIRTEMYRQGLEVAKAFEQNKQSRSNKALQKLHTTDASVGERDRSGSPTPETEDSTSGETLFGESLTTIPSAAPSLPTDPDPTSWSITPTISYPPRTRPPPPAPPILPEVDPSSYALFAHLHELGYFMSPGIRFGCQFSVYPGDPLRFHSHFLAMSYGWDEEIDLLDLVGGGRLGTGVKKGWLLGGPEEVNWNVEDGQSKSDARTFCMEWGGM